jgi:hypothetical protein
MAEIWPRMGTTGDREMSGQQATRDCGVEVNAFFSVLSEKVHLMNDEINWSQQDDTSHR